MEGTASVERALVVGVLHGRGLALPDLCLAVEGMLARGADKVDLEGVSDEDRAAVVDSLPGRVVADAAAELAGAVTTASIPAMAVAVVNGCRRIRTADVRAARRVADVLAAVARGTAPS